MVKLDWRGVRRTARGAGAAFAVVLSVLSFASCGKQTREGTAASFLIIDSLTAASGATPDDFGTQLFSDVQTLVEDTVGGETVLIPTTFADVGRVNLRLVMRDPGTPGSPLTPTANNHITLTRYQVRFIRSDGRNTPGVDVPFGFDGGVTFTVAGTFEGGFEIVRHSHKAETPLVQLIGNGGAQFIHTIAEITFYGHDQTGRSVSVTGNITVNFGDWGDPE